MAHERILIVEDNVPNLVLAKMILLHAEYEVRTAVDAEEALCALNAWTPSLILMDLQLPRIDGLELTRRIKSDPARRHLIIVALTAYATPDDHARAIGAGCDGYLSKPLDIDTLLHLVAELLARAAPSGGA